MAKRVLAVFILSLSLMATPARADYFVWQDPLTGAVLTFPDRWKMVSLQAPDEMVRIMGPDSVAQPMCRLRGREDNQFTVYPVRYSRAVQQMGYSTAFWDRYLGEFDNVQVHSQGDSQGLGRAFASMRVASYTPAPPAPFVQRTAVMFAGVAFDRAYVFECSSTVDAFKRYLPTFESIAKSVGLRKSHHELMTGDYRDFITNQEVRIRQPDSIRNEQY